MYNAITPTPGRHHGGMSACASYILCCSSRITLGMQTIMSVVQVGFGRLRPCSPAAALQLPMDTLSKEVAVLYMGEHCLPAAAQPVMVPPATAQSHKLIVGSAAVQGAQEGRADEDTSAQATPQDSSQGDTAGTLTRSSTVVSTAKHRNQPTVVHAYQLIGSDLLLRCDIRLSLERKVHARCMLLCVWTYGPGFVGFA